MKKPPQYSRRSLCVSDKIGSMDKLFGVFDGELLVDYVDKLFDGGCSSFDIIVGDVADPELVFTVNQNVIPITSVVAKVENLSVFRYFTSIDCEPFDDDISNPFKCCRLIGHFRVSSCFLTRKTFEYIEISSTCQSFFGGI